MESKTDHENEFRIRPNRPRTDGQKEARAWSRALGTVLRYARSSGGKKTTSKRQSSGKEHRFSQRCAVRITYAANKVTGQWRAHGRYIIRDSAASAELSGKGSESRRENAAAELHRWQVEGDPRLWKLIVSPEFGDRIDLDRLSRDLMSRLEKDLGTKLEWVAVAHFNTEHPHIHVALRGIRDDKSPLELPRDYVRHGIRAIAQDLCTRQLGYRNQLDAMHAERREVQERRFTSLDKQIGRSGSMDSENELNTAEHFGVTRLPGVGSHRGQHLRARLAVLAQMGLARSSGSDEWLVRRDFEAVLRAMQRATDRQRMLAARGTVLSDERLQIAVLELRKLKAVEGRVLGHGEDDAGPPSGRHYLLLEGTDAKVHLLYYTPELERARANGKLRVNAFVRLQKQFENGRPILEVQDHGDAERILHNRQHLVERVKALSVHGLVPVEDGWGGWLGRYQRALRETAEGVARSPKTRQHQVER